MTVGARWSYRLPQLIVHIVLFGAAICLYVGTLNPDVQPADSGEFQLAAITLGIPHPPGYPLYTMLGWLFAQVPVASPFARVSFLSVIASSATLVLVSLTVQRLSAGATTDRSGGARAATVGTASPIPLLCGVIAALALGTSTTFWAQATTTNIRSLTAFFTALMLFAAAHLNGGPGRLVGEDRSPVLDRQPRPLWLIVFVMALGLGVGHHVSLIFVAAVVAVWVGAMVLRQHFGWRAFATCALVLLTTQAVWLYLPIRDAAGARFAPGNLTSLNGLLFHIFARGFAGDMLAFAAPQFLSDRIAILPTLFQFEFSLPVLVVTAFAAVALWLKRPAAGITLSVGLALHVFITITYRAPQTVEYAMPAWVILCVVLGAGLSILIGAIGDVARGAMGRSRRAPMPRSIRLIQASLGVIVCLFMGALVIGDGYQRLPSFVSLANDRSTRAQAEGVLRDAVPQQATVLAQWHQVTPMWALQDVEGQCRDVRVEYVYPRGAQPYADTFAEETARYAQLGATYVTSHYALPFAARGLTVMPLSGAAAWQVLTSTQQRLEPAIDGGLLFDARVQAKLMTPAAGSVEVGQSFDVVLLWQATGGIQADESLTVRLVRPDGRLAASADVRLDPNAVSGELHYEGLRLGIPLDLLPGDYPILVGAYRSKPGGFEPLTERSGADFAPAAQLTVLPAKQAPVTQHPSRWDVPGGASLVGIDYDTGIPGQWRVLTHWQLAASSVTITLQDSAGSGIATAQVLPASKDISGYLTLAFVIPPMRGIWMAASNVASRIALPEVADGERYVAFANQMVLVGTSVQRQATHLNVELHWLAVQSLVTDYIVSVRLTGADWSAAHDGVPALGALPTLKWIRGSRITDQHPVSLEGSNEPLGGAVLVYDSSTQQLLPPLDERYEHGITVPIP